MQGLISDAEVLVMKKSVMVATVGVALMLSLTGCHVGVEEADTAAQYGVETVGVGVDALKDGVEDVKNGVETIKDGVDTIRDGVNTVRDGVQDVKESVQDTRDTVGGSN